MFSLEFTAEAKEDIADASEWYAEIKYDLGVDFLNQREVRVKIAFFIPHPTLSQRERALKTLIINIFFVKSPLLPKGAGDEG